MISCKNKGFSLIELIVTLSVMAILIAVAAPSLGDFIRKNRTASGINNLILSINYAKSESIKTGHPTILCPTSDSSVTLPNCDTSGDWSGMNFVVMRDNNRNGAPTPNKLLHVFDGVERLSVTSEQFPYIRFLPGGSIENGGGSSTINQFVVVPEGCKNDEARVLSINRMGRSTSKKMNCP